MSDSIETVGILRPLSEEDRLLLTSMGKRFGWQTHFVTTEQSSSQLDLSVARIPVHLLHFNDMGSVGSFLQKPHFEQFRKLYKPLTTKQTAGKAFNSLVDTRPFAWNRQMRRYEDQLGDPVPFRGLKTSTLSDLGFEPIEYEDSKSQKLYRTKHLANYAIQVGSLIDAEWTILESRVGGTSVQDFMHSMITTLKEQVSET